ncbi:MAG: dTDP-4-dehydrorhamnose 3,5-epimerase [Acetatifactor sp.]|nr:dTDP-4-dehydrorhamnose 3,5-epimerase [Acetatifactor sp.]
MKIISTEFSDIKIIESNHSTDERGSFIKIFNEAEFLSMGLQTEYKETYFSISQKDVIRGMHFQIPPYDHEKLVHVIAGSIIDVVVDLRRESPDFKKHIAITLLSEKRQSIYIPKGFAHGFRALEDNTVMLYQVASGYHPNSDSGIAYDSIGFDWGIGTPVLSKRDQGFIRLDDFVSPF